MDSLARLWRAALAVQATTDSTRRLRYAGDTLREGHFLVLTDSAHTTLARQAAAIVSPKLDRAYGTQAANMRRHIIVLRRRYRGTDSTQIESGVVGTRDELSMLSSDIPEPRALANSWQRKAEEFITQDLGPPITEWIGTTIPSDPPSLRDIVAGRVDLVLANSRVAHDCVKGDYERCKAALSLVSVEDPAFTLFDEDQRREILEHNALALRRADQAKYARCAVDHLQATCDSLVRTIPADAIAMPVPPSVRRNFLQYALMMGGGGAFDRLAHATGPVVDRIAAASGVPLDTLVRRWHATLMSSQGSSTAIDVTTAISSLFWATLCGALSLRSSRWR